MKINKTLLVLIEMIRKMTLMLTMMTALTMICKVIKLPRTTTTIYPTMITFLRLVWTVKILMTVTSMMEMTII